MAAEPEAALAVVESCGHLPLAIRLAGSRLAHRPNWRVADLAKLLASNARRLDHLTSGDRSVAGAFAASYASLKEPAQRLFRLLSMHPGDEFGLLVASALSGLPLDDTVGALDGLLDCHLIDESAVGRYRMHDLIRQYAHDLSSRVDQVNVRRSALGELLDLMLHMSLAAADTVERSRIRNHVSLGPRVAPTWSGRSTNSPISGWKPSGSTWCCSSVGPMSGVTTNKRGSWRGSCGDSSSPEVATTTSW
ncbi:hypothetical protein GCM10029963_47380 [Micromonospora andamanensis]